MAEARLTDKTLGEFADALASRRPVPGGGGAAAYVGALAAALCSMVGEYTLGKKRYACYEEDIREMLAAAETMRHRLVQLVDEDAEAFYPLSQAYALSKDDPSRDEVLERATKHAIMAPYEMMHQLCDLIELLEEMGTKGSRMLLSVVGSGALLARGALEAASLNVFVNTRSMTDRAWADRIEAECEQMLLDYRQRAEAVAHTAMNVLREREERGTTSQG
jgi:formiminotetrahydrofolate cyclodeaminase